MNYLTIQQLEDLGFEIYRSSCHDLFITQIRVKGYVGVETTWLKTGKFYSQKVYIKESHELNFISDQIRILYETLNK